EHPRDQCHEGGQQRGGQKPCHGGVADSRQHALRDQPHHVRAGTEEDRVPEAEQARLSPEEGEAHRKDAVARDLRELGEPPLADQQGTRAEQEPDGEGQRDAGALCAHLTRAPPVRPCGKRRMTTMASAKTTICAVIWVQMLDTTVPAPAISVVPRSVPSKLPEPPTRMERKAGIRNPTPICGSTHMSGAITAPA